MNQNQKTKTKMLLKAQAQIKLHPEVQKKIDKATKIFIGIMIAITIIFITYIIYVTICPPKETTAPSKEEIKTYCEQHNMMPNGYTISYKEETFLWIFKKRAEEQAYITCKKEYPEPITEIPPRIPECCYPRECPQATNNPKYCNCIYLIYCLKTPEGEYRQWSYKITGK